MPQMQRQRTQRHQHAAITLLGVAALLFIGCAQVPSASDQPGGAVAPAAPDGSDTAAVVVPASAAETKAPVGCLKCGGKLGSAPFACSHKCTFCPGCALDLNQRCPNCRGRLKPRS